MRGRLIPGILVTLLLLTTAGCAAGNKKSLLEYDYPPGPPGTVLPYPGPNYVPGTLSPYPPYLYPYYYP